MRTEAIGAGRGWPNGQCWPAGHCCEAGRPLTACCSSASLHRRGGSVSCLQAEGAGDCGAVPCRRRYSTPVQSVEELVVFERNHPLLTQACRSCGRSSQVNWLASYKGVVLRLAPCGACCGISRRQVGAAQFASAAQCQQRYILCAEMCASYRGLVHRLEMDPAQPRELETLRSVTVASFHPARSGAPHPRSQGVLMTWRTRCFPGSLACSRVKQTWRCIVRPVLRQRPARDTLWRGLPYLAHAGCICR